MKVNELMIGDWVMFQHGIDKIVDLPYICGMGLCASFSASATLFLVPIEQLNPIPLTPEILEKNGFVYSDLPFEQSWQQYGLSIYGTTGNYHINCGMNVSMDVSNVHQLQHALRICGIEKEIVL